MHGLNVTLGQRIDAFTVFIGPGDDLVIHVGNVTYVGDIQASETHITHHRIKHDQYTRMPQVAQVIDSHTTDVHAHLARLDWLEFFLFAGQAVIDLQHDWILGINRLINSGGILTDMARQCEPGYCR